jgi:Tfp pilus assembly protein PilF
MGISLLIAAALATQPAGETTVNAPAIDSVDVAYEELRDGRNADAMAKLENSRLIEQHDPAALINLGTAYARTGNLEKARDCYHAAMMSDERYVLELANGRWIDSRRVAKMASEALTDGKILAIR